MAERIQIVLALIRRESLIVRTYPMALAVDLVFGIINLVVYYFISRALPHGTSGLQGADNYFAYVAIGVTVITVIQSAAVALARRVREEQLTGSFEALALQPIGPVELALGLTGFPFAFALLRALLYLALAQAVLGLGLDQPDWIGAAAVLLGTGGLVAAIGISLAALAVAVARSDVATSLIAFALGMLGGAFFPLAVLPGWLQAVSTMVPTRFAFHGARAALFSGHGWGTDALVLGGLALVLVPVAVALFAASLELGRRRGTLTRG